MRKLLKDWYRDTLRGYRLLRPFVQVRDFLSGGGWMSDKRFIETAFQRTFGYPLDGAHPVTLNEKMNGMKLYVRDPQQQIAADKFAVRQLVRERVGERYLIPLIQTYTRAQDIRLSELPDSFILKVNHGSGQNWIVRDKAREDERRIQRQFEEWMSISHYRTSREWPYKSMRPVVVAEKLLSDDQGRIPEDYKLHCFNGAVAVIQVDLDRETDHRRNFYDHDWTLQPFIWTEWEGDRPLWPNGRAVERPAKLAEMIDVAQKLSAGFPYVRVDLFQFHDRVYFGELTFYHGSGLERFDPAEWDRRLGERLPWPPAKRPA